jgi:predicted nucleic acid-binding protein
VTESSQARSRLANGSAPSTSAFEKWRPCTAPQAVEKLVFQQPVNDEPDNGILECAVAGGADVIVTGDWAMLDLGSYEGIRMLTLREFLKSSK